jgi:hypothetical protein
VNRNQSWHDTIKPLSTSPANIIYTSLGIYQPLVQMADVGDLASELVGEVLSSGYAIQKRSPTKQSLME